MFQVRDFSAFDNGYQFAHDVTFVSSAHVTFALITDSNYKYL